MMLDDDNIAALKSWTDAIAKGETQLLADKNGRDDAIRFAHTELGAKARELSDITGLTPPRIYQILAQPST